MPIEFACESCKKLLRVPDGSGGLSCECPACRTLLEIPDPDAVKVVEAAGGAQGDSSDTLSIPCPKCAHELICSSKLLGTRGQCKNCKYIFTISEEGSPGTAGEGLSSGLIFTCPKCDQLFEGREEMRGRKGKCHACGEVFQIELRKEETPTVQKTIQKTIKRTAAQPKPTKPKQAKPAPSAKKKQPASNATPIQLVCTSCNGVMEVPAAAAGQTTACPYCQQLLHIPVAGSAQPSAAPGTSAPQAALSNAPGLQQPSSPQPDIWTDLGDMSGASANPYAAPATNPYAAPAAPSKMRRSRQPADLGKRLLGAIVDGLASFVFVVPGYGLMLAGTAGNRGEPTALFFIGLAVIIVAGLALLAIQVYLLATRSQTIGKLVMKTQIVDVNTGEPAGLVNTLLLRAFVNGLIGGIPCIGPIYTLVDICFIFGEDRRCIHDLIASTSVVDIS